MRSQYLNSMSSDTGLALCNQIHVGRKTVADCGLNSKDANIGLRNGFLGFGFVCIDKCKHSQNKMD